MRTTPTNARIAHPTTAELASVIAVMLVALTSVAHVGGTADRTTTFEFTGAPRTFVVPSGICRVRIEAVGGAGGPSGTAGSPGAGALVVAEVEVAPRERLRVRVGGWGGAAAGLEPGHGGWNGGGDGGPVLEGASGWAGSGGGGATDVRRGGDGLVHRVVVAGGGGGGAGRGIGGQLGTGGGNGGSPNGDDGLAVFGVANPVTGGGGATELSGGAPGRGVSDGMSTATAGRLGAGGRGAAGVTSGGGGGGGGLYGGGGGGAVSGWLDERVSGGHGGGGSSFGPSGATFRPGVGPGFGWVRIGYDADAHRCDR